ncbi:hypothetical protein KP509_29G035700 [Ceratopteris richardii]|uniref:Uncharacterized protein n=1 Tax=Ceratopteris richardii TaxID=49495 RepID=A0A8T2R883_CERRI|nr:hypothetical protein KP509_29G035700 [Ceratopteris richardii]
MTRAFVVEEVEASYISPHFRRWKHLDVVPYLKFTTEIDNSVVASSKQADQGLQETNYSDERAWKGPFIVPLNQAVQTAEERVVLSLYLRRRWRPDKHIAKLRILTGDYVTETISKSYEMKFVKEKFLARNANQKINVRITGSVREVDCGGQLSSPDHDNFFTPEFLKKVAQGLLPVLVTIVMAL